MKAGNLNKKLEELKIHFYFKSTESIINSISLMSVTIVSKHRTIRREALRTETLGSFYSIVSHIKADELRGILPCYLF